MKLTLLIILTLASWTQSHFTFTPLPDNTPIIFSNNARAHISFNNFNLLFYVDLEPCYNLIDTIKISIQAITELCEKKWYNACNITTAQLQYQLNLITGDDQFIHSINKRFILCEFCGKIQHHLYGTMDAETARHYDGLINDLENATISNHDLLAENARITKTLIEYNEKTFGHVEFALKNMREKIDSMGKNTSTIMDELMGQMTITHMIQTTQLAMTEQGRYHSKIRRTLSASKESRYSELIPIKQLTEELRQVASSLEGRQKLPMDPYAENTIHIFKYSNTKSTLFNRRLMIELSTPTTESEIFTLYKATPIPLKTQNGLVLASIASPYFLLNEDQTKYYPLSKKELGDGILLSDNQTLYRPTSPAILNSDAICEWKILMEKSFNKLDESCHFSPFADHNLLITISANDLYFCTPPDGTRVWEKCDDNKFDLYHISGRGTIQIDPNCTLKTASYIIQSHRTKRITAAEIITPTIGTPPLTKEDIRDLSIMKHLELASSDPIIINDHAELNELAKDARLLSHRADQKLTLERANYDNSFKSIFSGFAASGVLLLFVGSCMACILWRINFLSCLIGCLTKKSHIVRDHEGVITFNMNPEKIPKSFQSLHSLLTPDQTNSNNVQPHTSVDIEMNNMEKS